MISKQLWEWWYVKNINEPLDIQKIEIIKAYRDELLASTNWTQLSDAILLPSEKIAWTAYRDTLQSIDFTVINLDAFIFPDPPAVTSTSQTASIIAAKARLAQASKTARGIPSWALWTQAEADTWATLNIATPLASARTSLPATLTLATARAAFVVLLNILDKMWILQKANAQMTLAIRDEIWPDLPERTTIK
jgi:hypothetical protein